MTDEIMSHDSVMEMQCSVGAQATLCTMHQFLIPSANPGQQNDFFQTRHVRT
jgi:hypothetical protein